VWGALLVCVAAVWLEERVVWLRTSVLTNAPIAQAVDSRILMWIWLAGMSILMQFIYRGYVDVMLGLARFVGFAFPEQFWFTLFSKNPVEYWQNGNRSVYKITNYHVFNRFFGNRDITAKVVMATAASGVFHAFLCPVMSLDRGALLGVLFALNGVVVSVWMRISRSQWASRLNARVEDGPARNALILTGMVLTFTLLAFTRTAFLLMVEGVTVADWWSLMSLLFLRQTGD
jgi:D-alanyl-lipoteichoic acid acyltransferase DltB (MBOAT superfamily)